MARRDVALVIVYILLALFVHAASAEDRFLTVGRTERGELGDSQTVTYSMALQSNQFLLVRVLQLGVDVAVTVRAPSGRVLQQVDNLVDGPEWISLVSSDSGIYSMDLRPFYPMAPEGRYIVQILQLRPAAQDLGGKTDEEFEEFNRSSTPGIMVVVERDGEVVHANAFGMADLENGKPWNVNTPTDICSIGKQLTAFAIALLADRGNLKFDDDIRKYLPWVPDFGARITIQNLIHHTSGLRELDDLTAFSDRSQWPIRRADFRRYVQSQRDLNFQPGEQYLYCNTGYILLGEIIEAVTKVPFTEWMKEEVLLPLGMNDTFFFFDVDSAGQEFAWSYYVGSGGQYVRWGMQPAWYVGAGNVFTTADDMGRWLCHLENPRICPRRVVDQMSQIEVLSNGDSTTYAFAQDRQTYRGLPVLEHGGGGWGYRSYVLRFPEQRLAVLVATNFIFGRAFTRARNVADVYLSDYFTEPRPDDEYVNRRRAIAIDTASLERFTGTYRTPSGRPMTVSNKGCQLYAQVAGESESTLYPMTENRFFRKESDLVFAFDSVDVPASAVALISPTDASVFTRIDSSTTPAGMIEDLVGSYHSDELGITYIVVAHGDLLQLQLPSGVTLPLSPIGSDLYRAPYFSLAFDRNSESRVTSMRASSERSLNIRFNKLER